MSKGWPAVTPGVLLLFLLGCQTGSQTEAAGTSSPGPSPLASDPFSPPADLPLSTSRLPRVPATAGEPVQCSDLPVSGYYRIGYTTRSCWVIRENTIGSPDFFWMAGADMDHPTEGALVHGDVTGSDDLIEVAVLPGNHGRLTIRRAKRDVACVRAADGAWFLFRLGDRRFSAAKTDCTRVV